MAPTEVWYEEDSCAVFVIFEMREAPEAYLGFAIDVDSGKIVHEGILSFEVGDRAWQVRNRGVEEISPENQPTKAVG